MKRMQTQDLLMISLGTAVLVLSSWISIPLAVPFTMQTFGVFTILLVLGGRRGIGCILLYLLLGAAGFPVFSGFGAGIGILLGPTGGYLMGFVLMGVVFRTAEKYFGNGQAAKVSSLTAGLFLCYAFGTAWFIHVYGNHTGSVGLGTALSWCVLPFILPDLIKLGLALAVSPRIRKALTHPDRNGKRRERLK